MAKAEKSHYPYPAGGQLTPGPQGHFPQGAAVEVHAAPLPVALDILAQQGAGQLFLLLQIPIHGQGGQANGGGEGGKVHLDAAALQHLYLRSGGELTAELAPASRWETSRPEDHAAALLKDLGVEPPSHRRT